MDLEESLRMLVNLQETSEYIVDSQRKNWITLLDEDEDEEDNVVKMAKEKQIDLPSFSLVRDTSLKIEKLEGRGVKNPSTEQKESKPEKEKIPKDKPVMQAKPGFKEIWIPVEKQNGNNILPRNQQHKSPYNVELQQQSMALKSESPKEKRRWETKEQQI
ncbi:unnamed protein product [Malus baccata var. baccata]